MWAGVGSHSRVKLHTHKNQVVRTPHTPPQHYSVQRVHALLTTFLQKSAKDGTSHVEFIPSSVYPVRVGTQATGLNISGTIFLFFGY